MINSAPRTDSHSIEVRLGDTLQNAPRVRPVNGIAYIQDTPALGEPPEGAVCEEPPGRAAGGIG